MADEKGLFQNLNDSLSKVFRHVLPGMFILGFSYLSNPIWFEYFDLKNTNHLIVLSVLAIVIGNTWYVLNRYTIIQINDWIMTTKFRTNEHYHIWLSKHIVDSNSISEAYTNVKDVMFTKVGQLFFMLIVGESMIIITCFSSTNSIFQGYQWIIYLCGSILIAFSFWQIFLLLHMEQELIKRNRKISESTTQ